MKEFSENKPTITAFLNKWRNGDGEAFEELMDYVYTDLRRRASAYLRGERPDHSLQTTGLVHEAFIKLHDKQAIEWADRNHFFAVAAKAMRRILVDHARSRNRAKRGGGNEELPLDEAHYIASDERRVDLVALDEALNELAVFDKQQARIVELKYFGGMTIDETAGIIGISPTTVKREWQIARAWLKQKLR
jgi:RNA polymerase sigma factor (TIGR02999 family)